jgi:hypothetical protein
LSVSTSLPNCFTTALLVGAQLLAACTMWVPTTTPAPTYINEKHPSEVRLGLHDGSTVRVKWPIIVDDSLIRSDSASSQRSRNKGVPVPTGPSIAVRDVTTVESRQVSGVKTVALMLAIPLAAGIVVCALEECSAD